MMNRREANQRCEVNAARLTWLNDSQEYRVTLNEWRGKEVEAKAYYTDDLEDAVLTAAAMRKSA